MTRANATTGVRACTTNATGPIHATASCVTWTCRAAWLNRQLALLRSLGLRVSVGWLATEARPRSLTDRVYQPKALAVTGERPTFAASTFAALRLRRTSRRYGGQPPPEGWLANRPPSQLRCYGGHPSPLSGMRSLGGPEPRQLEPPDFVAAPPLRDPPVAVLGSAEGWPLFEPRPLPDGLHGIGVNRGVARDEREALGYRLRDQDPVKRILVVTWQCGESCDVACADLEYPSGC